MLKSGLTFFLILFLFTNEAKPWGPDPARFYPLKDGFNIFEGPDERMIIQANSCDQMVSFQAGLLAWKQKVEPSGSLQTNNCQCGKDQIEPSLAGFLVNKRIEEYSLENWRLIKRVRAKKEVLADCYIDVTSAFPTRALDLARRQMALDSDMFQDSYFDVDGVNCYNTGLYINGLIQSERYIDDYEIHQFLVEPICQAVDISDPRPGDIIAYYWQDPPYYQRMPNVDGEMESILIPASEPGFPIHVASYIADGLIFDKKGGRKDRPFQLSSEAYTEQVYQNPDKILSKRYFRCLSPNELEDYLSINPDISALWREVEEIEDCYKEYYLKQAGPLGYSIQDLRENALEMVIAQIDEMLNERRTYDRSTFTYTVHEGMQEEVTILKIIRNKAQVMIQDQFGRYF